MKKKVWMLVLSVALVAALAVTSVVGYRAAHAADPAPGNTTPARNATPIDASNGLTFDALDDDHIKLVGRTSVEDTYLRMGFCGTGFKLNVHANSNTTFELKYRSTWAYTVNILVDGTENRLTSDTAKVKGEECTFSVPLTSGNHAIELVMESQMQRIKTQAQADEGRSYFHFTSLKFNGTITGREEDKPYYIEVVGDSITGGCASLKEYEAGGLANNLLYNKASISYAYYLANMVNADLSNVSEGSIGLSGSNSQEDATTAEPQLDDIYFYQDYGDFYEDIPYDFSRERKPDLIILAIGANDGYALDYYKYWEAEAKAFLLKIKEVRGDDVPILWACRAGKTYQYKAIRDLIDNDPDISAYDDIEVTTSWFYDGNGRSTIYGQYSGHPDPYDQYKAAERMYNYVKYAGYFDLLEEDEPDTEYVYYVDENGSATGAGTATDPVLTIPQAITKFKSAHSSVPAGAALRILVTGEVDATGNAQALGGLAISTQIFCKDGTLLPIIVETKDYDGTNRARLNLMYNNVLSGSGHHFSYQPVTYKNVELYGVNTDADSKYAINKFDANGVKVVFDNVVFGNSLNIKWIFNGAGFTYNTSWDGAIAGTETIESNIEFRNCNLNASNTTAIAPIAYPYLYKAGGNYTEVPGMKAGITFGEGATVDASILSFATSNCLGMSVKDLTIEFKTGSVMTGAFKGTISGTDSEPKSTTNNLNFVISGGKLLVDSFHMLGSYFNVTGDLYFHMLEGQIYTIGTGTTASFGNSILLAGGAKNNTIDGNIHTEINGGLLYLTDASASTSSIISVGGDGQIVNGDETNDFIAPVVVFDSKNDMACSAATGLYLAHASGAIKGTLTNNLVSGSYDGYIHQVSGNEYSICFFLGSKNISDATYRVVNNIGEISPYGKGVGPQFHFIGVHAGSQYGEYGVKSYSKDAFAGTVANEDVFITNYYGGLQKSSYFYLGPTGKTTDTATCYVAGNVKINIYDPKAAGTTGATLFGSEILGSAEANIEGGYFQHIYGTTTGGCLIDKGLTINVKNAKSYSAVQDPATENKWYRDFWPVNQATVNAPDDGPALKVTISDSTLDNIHLNAKDETSVINGDVEYAVESGKYRSVTVDTTMPGAATEPCVTGGSYVEKPDETALIPSGYSLSDSEVVGYNYDVVKGTARIHENHCFCGGNCEGVNNAYSTHTCQDDIVWEPITGTMALPRTNNATYYYYLRTDVTLTEQCTLGDNEKIYICLNGHKLTRAGKVFLVGNKGDAELHICDCSEEGTGFVENTDTAFANAYSVIQMYCLNKTSKALVELYGGTIMGTSAVSSASYGGIMQLVDKSVFNMYGGKVCGHPGITGGNVNGMISVSSTGIMNMYGGTISGGNYPNSGANVFVKDSTAQFNMYDGIIENGTSTSNVGGNLLNSGIFRMYGGEIKGGVSGTDSKSGNVYANTTTNKFYLMGGKIYGDVWIRQTADMAISGDMVIHDGDKGLNLNRQAASKYRIGLEDGTYAAMGSNADVLVTEYVDGTASELPVFLDGTTADEAVVKAAKDVGKLTAKTVNNVAGLYLTAAEHTHCICGGNCETAAAAGHTCDEDIVWQAWTSGNGPSMSSSAPQYFYLAEDITLGSALTIASTSVNLNLNICLNGHTLKTASTKRAFILWISGATALNATLNICDCKPADSQGTILGNGTVTSQGGIAFVSQGATMTLYGGNIKGGTTKTYGGNIAVAGTSTFTMYGGVIENGSAETYGGGVAGNGTSASFVMYGGTIRNNSAASGSTSPDTSGGGNVAASGTIIINGGEISGGTLTDSSRDGGNIHLMNAAGSLTINGGTIKDGVATRNGGNIACKGDLTITGGTISGGTISGGNGGSIYINNSDGECRITGGTLIGGTSKYSGANMYISGGVDVTIEETEDSMPKFVSGTINNTTNTDLSNIVCGSTGTLLIKGGYFNNEDGGRALYVKAGGTTSISGGHFNGTILKDSAVEALIEGGYFLNKPNATYIKEGYVLKDLGSSPEEFEGIAFKYTVALGAPVYIGAAVLEGDFIPVTGLIGGDNYGAGDSVTVTAPKEQNGYRFMYWAEDGKAVSTDVSYTFTATGERTLKAMYQFGEEMLNLTITADKTGTVKVTDGSGKVYTNTENVTIALTGLTRGDFTVEFLGESDSFKGWENESKKIVSSDTVYTLTLNMNTSLNLVSTVAGDKGVVFLNDYGQVLREDWNISDFTNYQAPSLSARVGKDGKWTFASDGADFTAAELETRLAAADYVEVVAVYTKTTTAESTYRLYKVTIDGNTPSSTDLATTELLDTITASVGAYVEISTEDEEKLLGIFDASAGQVSVTGTYSLRVTEEESADFFAVYTNGEAEAQNPVTTVSSITVQKQSGTEEKYTMSVTATYSSPYEVIEKGFIFIPATKITDPTTEKADGMLYKGAANVVTYVSTVKGESNAFTLNMKNAVPSVMGDVRYYMKSYVVYKTTEGIQGIIYSDMVEPCLNDFLK